MTSLGLDELEKSGVPKNGIFLIIIKKNGQRVKKLNIPTSQAHILLDVFKASQSFKRAIGKEGNRWTFNVETDEQVQEIIQFLTTGVRSLMPSGSIELQGTGIDVATNLINIKSDYKYPEYLEESELDNFRLIWEEELQAREAFSILAKERGLYESNNKIDGEIPGHVFAYDKVELKQDPRHRKNTLDVTKIKDDVKYVAEPSSVAKEKYVTEPSSVANATFLSKVSQQHILLFTRHPLARKFCVAGNSVLDSITNKDHATEIIDIYPLVPEHVSEFVKDFVREVQRSGYVELLRSKNAIDVVWYPNTEVLLRKIFFPWLKSTGKYIDNDKQFTDIAMRQQVIVRGKHEAIHNHIVVSGYRTYIEKTKTIAYGGDRLGHFYREQAQHRGIDERVAHFIPQILKEYGYVIDGADLPQTIKNDLKKYLKHYLNQHINYDDFALKKNVRNSISNNFEAGKVVYRINLQRYSSVHEVLSRINVDSSCFAYYMGNIYLTQRGHHALVNGVNVVDPTRQNAHYHKHLLESKDRGYDILVPSLDSNNIIFHDNTQDTLGLSKLILDMIKHKRRSIFPEPPLYFRKVLTYDSNEVVRRIVNGWTESGYKTKCTFSEDILLPDDTNMIQTPFYFSAYIKPFDLLLYRSRINYVDDTILKIRNYPSPDIITVDNVSVPTNYEDETIKKYIEIRSNRNVYSIDFAEYNVSEENLLESKIATFSNKYFDDNMRYQRELIASLTNCLVLQGNGKHFEGENYGDVYLFDVHPIVQTPKEYISFIKNTVRMLGDKFDVLMYRRSEEQLDILLDRKNEAVYPSSILDMLNWILIIHNANISGYDGLIKRMKDAIFNNTDYYVKYNKEDVFATMNRDELKDIYDTATSLINNGMYRRLLIRDQKKYVNIANNIKMMLNNNQDSYAIHNQTKEERAQQGSVIVRINYTVSSDIADAFTFIHHANQCVGWHNGSIVYNDRFQLYAETNKIVLDPAFRKNDMFEQVLYTGIDSVRYDRDYNIVLPYDRKLIRLWKDMKINGNLHDFLLRRGDDYTRMNGIDENWNNSSGVTPYVEHRRTISFTDPNVVTDTVVTTTVGNMLTDGGNLRMYSLDFARYAIRKAKPVPDYHESVVKYGKMAFLDRKQAIDVIKKKLAQDGVKSNLSCSG